MRVSITALAFLATSVIAFPATEADYDIRTAEDELLPIGDLEWTGPVIPGGPELTLRGDAKSIYDQIFELNPSYDAFDFPDLAEEFSAQGITQENFNETIYQADQTPRLEARASISCKHGKWIGNYAHQCGEGIKYLRKLHSLGRRCRAEKYKCARVSCSQNCGMFYCNNNKDKAITAKAGDIANDIKQIGESCPYSGTFPFRVRGRKSFSKHYIDLSASKC